MDLAPTNTEHEVAVVQPAPSSDATHPLIMEAVRSGNSDIIKEAKDFLREVRTERQREAFNSAFATAMLEVPTIKKTKHVKRKSKDGRPAGEFSYAPLEEIMGTVQPILAKHGMHLGFQSTFDGSRVEVVGILRHVAGGAETTAQSAPVANIGPNTVTQNKAATETSLQRSIAAGILGLAVGEAEEEAPYQAASDAPQYDIDAALRMIDSIDNVDRREAIRLELKAGSGESIGNPPRWALPQLKEAWKARRDAMVAEWEKADA